MERTSEALRSDMADHISWHVELQVKPGHMAAFRALTREMVQATKAERGALIYERFIADDNEAVHVFERYSDSAAAVAHLRTFAQMYGKRFTDLVDRKHFSVFGTPTPELRQILDPLGARYFAPLAGFSRG